ncbi:endonuclease/exonuclease/phosphatase family protein [Nonomuraea longicatena]|uniref:Endonuclease/exonuclease/phosphatase family protein n=1 Tax=Nonomuraea longicatena TaxID=83682 RepID=A0ABN1QSN3_9ACTN
MFLLAVVAFVRLTGLEAGPLLTRLMALTPYVSVLAALVAALLFARNRPAALVALVACVTLAGVVVPRTFAESAGEGEPLRVLTLNVAGRQDPRVVVELVRRFRPHVFSAVGLPAGGTEGLRQAGIEQQLPYTVPGLYSTYRLRALDGVQGARLEAPSGPIEVFSVRPGPKSGWHGVLPPPSPEAIRVLAGDFGASLDHRAFRQLLKSGYADAAARVGKGLVPTWPSGRRVPPFVTVDHVVADARVEVRQVEVVDVPGFEHRAVYAELAT